MVGKFECVHLQPFVDALLSAGAIVLHTETGWPNVRAALVLSQGPTIAEARKRWRKLPEGVERWWNDDGR